MSDQSTFFANASEVLGLFLIPIGGGIPAGVLLAKARGLEWPITTGLYLISDIILAFLFEPVMHLFIMAAKHSKFLSRFIENYKAMLGKTGVNFGAARSPLSLIAISFGVDPMTGRAAARAAGHGFITGWSIAICGDMFFFGLIMASTLWLNSILGDGTLTALIIMGLMIVAPMLYERWKKQRHSP